MKTIAMTLGPIVDTLGLGRKTSEIWAASYLFSKLMKETLNILRAQKDVRILIPYAEDDALFEPKDDGIGRFHDRMILQTDTLGIKEVREAFDQARDKLADGIAESIKENNRTVRAQLADYLRCYILQTDKRLEHPVLELSDKLDALELHTPPLPLGDEALRKFLRRNVILDSTLAKESFGAKPSFASIPAIAAQENDKDLENSEGFKNAYRYIAIVHADGDNLGEVLKDYGRTITDFSEKLFDFSTKASKLLEDFGAQTLYIGGDDLLFFAPVLHKEGRTVFDLIERLDEAYRQSIDDERTTLSFGVSVTYYKYPLYEALERSRNALFDTAKQYPGKNAVAVAVQKHSGQSFAFVAGKEEKAYDIFRALLGAVLRDETEIPHNIHHKLDTLRPLIEAKGNEVGAIFENFFNEEIHQTRFADGLGYVRRLIEALGVDEKAQKRLFAMLSTVKLLRGDR